MAKLIDVTKIKSFPPEVVRAVHRRNFRGYTDAHDAICNCGVFKRKQALRATRGRHE